LDKDTTGLLLFAKTDDALSSLGKAMEARQITREYLAIAWGNFPQDKGLIAAPIGRNTLDRKRMAVTPFSAKTATTKFEVIERFNIATYLRLKLLTGRTHQIRVHLTHYGHPVVGDGEYGGRSKSLITKQSDSTIFKKILSLIDRQALHAYKLGFTHPHTGMYVEFSSPQPEDFANVLKYLKSIS
jgi:23S rRNA pseudouridine1911/1915/1917 synthase